MYRLLFGISGASGTIFANSILSALHECGNLEIYAIISDAAKKVAEYESPIDIKNAFEFLANDFSEPCASGSWSCNAMIICPCSLNTLGAIAHGLTCNLIHRSAQVALKEKRPLILVLRETPFSLITIRNMQLCTEAGATIMPFIPAFYAVDDSMKLAARQFAGHILDLLSIPNTLRSRWEGNSLI